MVDFDLPPFNANSGSTHSHAHPTPPHPATTTTTLTIVSRSLISSELMALSRGPVQMSRKFGNLSSFNPNSVVIF